ncbi:hypothetical protein G7Z17_g1374 [Cylindrodendrum hubeiense]|uniref:Uncharacterized protein n=1 Tax=Cylindrodendrum hubeiense TaxID=595255 RepID=A0A9P5HJR1_9HYPO|nr:hypothetical protein G7Z17_g1374 [Cylindrodendrum hubeiense]
MATESRLEEMQQIQNELDIEIIPGTEIMADIGSHHFVKSEDKSNRVLVPQPSNDPHDPLNWTKAWKLSTLVAVSTMSFTQGFAPLALGPMFGYLMQDYDRSLTDVIQFTGVTILVLGFSNFIWLDHIDDSRINPGAMADHTGWPSFWWLNAAMTAASLVAIVFGFPETMYNRVEASEGQPPSAELSVKAIEIQHEEKATNEKSTTSDDNQSNVNAERDPCLGKGTPSRQQWKLFQSSSVSFRSILLDVWIPWKLFSFPIVLFASFVVSWSCSFILILNLTQTQVFAAPPYNMSSQSIGKLMIRPIGAHQTNIAGPLSDWVSARATARNNGIREPEMRLPAMIPYVLIMAFGHIITAIGYQRHWPWPVIVVLGYSCAGIQVAGLPSISSTYAVDSYKPVAGSLFVAITVNKNLWGYGMGRFITPWTEANGFINAFIVNMVLTFIWCLFAIMFYFYGKTFRRWTKDSIVHRL